jgi:hypothetical protein
MLGKNDGSGLVVTEIRKQYKNIDVLVTVNDVIYIIIEDKTTSNVHDNQLKRYKEIIEKEEHEAKEIVVVYLKTGFFDNQDKIELEKARKEDALHCKIDGNDLLDIIKPYRENSEILSEYIDYLKDVLKKDDDTKNEYKQGCCNALSKKYGQHLFMIDIFGENAKLRYFQDRGGLNIQYRIADYPKDPNSCSDPNKEYEESDFNFITYRLQSRGEKHKFGLSLRLYADPTKNPPGPTGKAEFYNKLNKIFISTVSLFDTLNVEPVKNNASKIESEFGVFYLSDNSIETLKEYIPNFTEKFLQELLKNQTEGNPVGLKACEK